MGRDKARRGGRRDGGRSGRPGPGWDVPHNQLTRAGMFPGTQQEMDRQRQDFLAGTVFAAGAGVVFPQGGTGKPLLRSMFTIYLQDGPETYGPAPQLAKLWELHAELGAVALHERSTVATGWSALDHPAAPLIKLKLDIREPAEAKGKCEIVLLAANYAEAWQHIVGGGMIGLSTFERMQAAAGRPDASFTDGMDASILLGIGSSSVVEMLMRNHGWPGA
jgi:hypothetical protein